MELEPSVLGHHSETGCNMYLSARHFFVTLLAATIALSGSLVRADHGHGGGPSFSGHSFSGGHMSVGHFGGMGGFSHWGGNGFNHWNAGHFHSGFVGHPYSYAYHRPYYRYARPFYFSPFVYGYFGYPYMYGNYGYPTYYDDSYPYDYFYGPGDVYANQGNSYAIDSAFPQAYFVSRPVNNVAQVEIRLPDPQATIWVEGKQMTGSGTVRQYKSPPLDPADQYTYDIRAEWNVNGKPVTDERRVSVQANMHTVVDFTQPAPADQAPAIPELPAPKARPPIPPQQ